MPPAAKRDCSVILFDLCASDVAKKALIKICGSRYFTKKKDLTKLILFNSDKSNNLCNARKGGHLNISEVLKDVSPYNTKIIIKAVEENNKIGKGDWLEGLLVALKHLEEDYEDIGGVVTSQVLFLTELSTPIVSENNRKITSVIREINRMNAFVYVVGPDVNPPFQITDSETVRKWMMHDDFIAPNENLTILKELISQTKNTIVCNYRIGIHLFYSFKNYGGSQAWKVPLKIGNNIKIPSQTVKIINDEPTVHLSSKRCPRRELWLDVDDETEEYEKEEVVFGIERHGVFVQMPERKMFQVESTRGLEALSFTDSFNIPESLLRGGGTYCVMADGGGQALHDLIDCLAEKKKYVIARRVYNNNYLPKLVVLIPKPNFKPKCFVLISLPFGDYLPVPIVERRGEDAPKNVISDGVFEYLDSLNIENESNFQKLPLAPAMMQDINIQRVVNKASELVLEKHLELDELDFNFSELVGDSKILEKLKSAWPVREKKAHKKKEENYDSDDDMDFEDF